MAGGGPSGKIRYPAYVETKHSAWLDDVDTIIQAELIAGSPYNGVTSFDPGLSYTPATGSPLELTQTAVTNLNTVVATIDETVDWSTLFNIAVSKADEALFDETVLINARTAFNSRTEDEFVSGINNLSTWAAGNGAVDGSAFAIGLVLNEMTRQRRVNDFDAELQLNLYKIRTTFSIQAVSQMLQVLSMRLSGLQGVIGSQGQLSKDIIIAKKEQTDLNLEYDVQDSLFDLKLFAYAGQLMAAPGGGVPIPNEPSAAASALGGAASGAAAGASLGPWGIAAGGLIGGLGGLLS